MNSIQEKRLLRLTEENNKLLKGIYALVYQEYKDADVKDFNINLIANLIGEKLKFR